MRKTESWARPGDWARGADPALELEEEGPVRFTLASALTVALVIFTALSTITKMELGRNSPFVIAGTTVYLFDILLLGTTALTLVRSRVPWRTGLVPSNTWVLGLVLTYLSYQVLVVLPMAAFAAGRGLIPTIRVMDVRFAVILFVFFYPLALSDYPPRHLVRAFEIAGLLLAVLAVVRYVGLGPQTYFTGDVERLRQLYGGSCMVLGWLIVTRLFLYKTTALNLLMVAAGLVGLVLVNHRAAYVALVAAIGAQMALNARSRRRVVAVLLLTALGAFALAFAPPMVRQSADYSLRVFVGQQDANTTGRLTSNAAAWDYFLAHPLGDYAASHSIYLSSIDDPGIIAHNFFMALLQYEGLPAALFYMALFAIVARIVIANRRRDLLITTMGSYIVFNVVFALFNGNVYSKPVLAILPAAVGIVLFRNDQLARGALRSGHPPAEAAASDAELP